MVDVAIDVTLNAFHRFGDSFREDRFALVFRHLVLADEERNFFCFRATGDECAPSAIRIPERLVGVFCTH